MKKTAPRVGKKCEIIGILRCSRGSISFNKHFGEKMTFFLRQGLTIQSRLVSELFSSYLSVQRAEITGMCDHAQVGWWLCKYPLKSVLLICPFMLYAISI
jgi:hypothetical protein